MNTRLNKLLASRGVAARRKCDELIEAGHVTVNGQVVRTLGIRVDEEHDHIKVKGKRISGAPAFKYYVLNKPVGVISTMSDPEGRRSIKDMLPRGGPRLFPVGRLDADTSGILLLTNDGELAHKLMHPRYGVEKFYRVIVRRTPMPYQLEKLKRGVSFEKGVRSAPARVRARTAVSRGSVIEIVLSEGRYRQVRKMCETVGLDVVALHRWGYGPVRLGELARGMWRELSASELASLQAAAVRPKATSKLGPMTSRPAPRPTVARSVANTPAGRRARPATRAEAELAVVAARERSTTTRGRGAGSPARSGTPRTRSTAPSPRGSAPRTRTTVPRARSESPRTRPTASRTRAAAPRARSESPRTRPAAARSRTATPRSRGGSSRTRPTESRPRSASTRPRIDSPRPRSAGPRTRTAEARPRGAAPHSRTSDTRSRSATPRSRSATPARSGRSSSARDGRGTARGPRSSGAPTRGKTRSAWAGSRSDGPSRGGSSSTRRSGSAGSRSSSRPKSRR